MELRCPSCRHSLYTLNKVYEVHPIGDLPTERFKYECPYCSAKLNREEVKKVLEVQLKELEEFFRLSRILEHQGMW